MKIKINELKSLIINVLKENYSQEEAEKITEVFLYAELTGKDTQGILKLFGSEPAQNIKPKYPPKIIKETELSVVIDGGGAAGPLVAQVATEKVIEIAKTKMFGITATNNTFSSVGAISFYARKIAQNNLIGIIAASSPRGVLHHGGIDPVYGTNPIAFGFPTMKHPIVFDMATSAITWYGLVRAKALGQNIPENVAVDHQGNSTRDPDIAMKGAILPFDNSYKGTGLGMIVELLAGALTGASYVFDEGDWGTTYIAISPELLIGTEEFKKNSSDLILKVKQSKVKEGQKIKIPGYDKEIEMARLIKSGEIEVEDKILDSLRAL